MTTRRGLLAGAATGAVVAPGLAFGDTVVQARRRTVRRGRALAVSPHGVVVAHERLHTVSVHGALVDVGGQPLSIAVSPNGRVAAVTTASWDGPGLALVDLELRKLRTRVAVGKAPFGVAYAGSRIVVAGGEQDGEVFVVDARSAKVLAHAALGRCPRTVAADPRRHAVWVALNGAAAVAQVDARAGRTVRELPVPELPDALAVSPDGKRLLVGHGERASVSEVDIRTGRVHRHRAGRHVTGVAYTPQGRRVVAVGGDGVVLVGRRRHRVGGAPRGVVVHGRHALTVDGLTGAVRRVKA